MAGPSNQELNFILKLQDQASSQLKQFIGSLNNAGSEANDSAKQTEGFGESIDELVAKANAAGAALEGLFDPNKPKAPKKGTDDFSAALDNLVGKAKEAAAAIAGVWASSKLANSSVQAFSAYEQALYGIGITTQQSEAQLEKFDTAFTKMVRDLHGVDTHDLQHLSQIAGQLGLRSQKDILGFASTMGKLSTVFPDVGEAGAVNIGRILYVTGELHEKGSKAVTEFSDALAYMQTHTKASASELTDFSSAIAASTQGYKLSSKEILSIGAVAAQSNLQVQSTASSLQAALNSLNQAATYGGEGMRVLSQNTGVTQQHLKELIDTHPEKAFELLFGALKKANSASRLNLLSALGLDERRTQTVMNTLSHGVDDIQKKIAAVGGHANDGALDEMFAKWQATTAANTKDLANQFGLLQRDIGIALAPIYNVGIQGLKAAFAEVGQIMEGNRGVVETTIVSFVTLGTGIASAVSAIKIVGPAFLNVSANALSLGGVLKPLWALLGSGIMKIVRLTGVLNLLRVAIAAVGGPWAVVIAAAVGAATYVITHWEQVKKWFSDFWSWMKAKATGTEIKVTADVDKQSLDATKKKISDALKIAKGVRERRVAAGETPVMSINQEDFSALRQLNPQLGIREQIQAQADTIKKLRDTIGSSASAQLNPQGKANIVYTQEDVERIQRVYEYQKKISENPLFQQGDTLDKQIAQAAALTANAKQELAIQQAITDTVNKTGESEAKVSAEIGNRMRLLNQVKQASAFADIERSLQQQTQALGAITSAQQSQVSIIQKINDFEREHNTLLDDRREKLANELAVYNMQADAIKLIMSLNPQAKVEQEYQEHQKLLQSLRDANVLTEQQYQLESARLNQQKQQSDPIGKHIQDLRDQLRISQEYGDQQKISQTALEETNRLESQHVIITKELNEQIQKYAQAKVAADRANNSGFQGWAKGVGTLEDNLNKLQENFADGLSDAISGALSGQQGSFRQFLGNLGKQMLSMGIKQMMAQSILSAGNPAGQAATAQANSALNQIESLSKTGINSPQATITATQAIINATNLQGAAAAAGYKPAENAYASQNGAVQQTIPYTPIQSTPTLPPQSSIPTVGPAPSLAAVAPTAAETTQAVQLAQTAMPSVLGASAVQAAMASATKNVLENSTVQQAVTNIPSVPTIAPQALQAINPTGLAVQQATSGGAGAAFDIAKTQLGKVEGQSDINSFLNSGLKLQGFNNIDSAQTAWCSAFVNSSLAKVGLKGSGDLTASSFRNLGDKVDFKDLQRGDIAVTPGQAGRLLPPGQTGNHVGFATGQTRLGPKGEKQFEFMAGNDSHSGTTGAVDKYWRNANGVEFRRPTTLANGQPISSQVQHGTEAMQAAKPVQLDKTSLDALTKGQFPANRFDTSIPASIRNNNPGAMNYAKWEEQYGAARGGTLLNDGTMQGNKIATFPTPEAGAAAQFDWWKNKSPGHGPTIGDNLSVFSGGNSTKQYQDFLASKGFGSDTNIQDMLANKEQAISFGKAQSQWEGGKPFPMNDQQWSNAYDLYRQRNPLAANDNAPNTNNLGGALNGAPGTTGALNTQQINEQVKQLNTSFQQTGTSVQQAATQVKQFSTDTTQVGTATQQAQSGMQGLNQSTVSTGSAAMTASPSYMQLGMSTQQAGTSAQTAGSSFQQAGTQIQSAGSQAQMAGTSAGGATGGFGDLGGSLGGLMGPLSAVKGGIGSFGSSIMGLVQQLMSGMGGMGGGMGGGGGFFGLLGGLFAEGGEIKGPGTGTSDSILAQVSNGEFIVNAASAKKNLPLLHAINNDNLPGNAPKFAKGGHIGGSSLGIGERALARGSAQPSSQIAALSAQVGVLTKAMSNGGNNGQRVSNISQNITVNANDAGSFRRSEGQLTSDAFLKMNRAARRNG